MELPQTDFPSRLSARAITAGVVCFFALMILFMTLAGGFGLWRFDIMELPELGPAFWMWTFVSWILSNYLSGYVAATAARSMKTRDGLLHGLVIWASVCVIGTLAIGVITGAIFNGILVPVTSTVMFWGAFIGDAMGLGAAMLGGLKAVTTEALLSGREETMRTGKETKLEPAFTH